MPMPMAASRLSKEWTGSLIRECETEKERAQYFRVEWRRLRAVAQPYASQIRAIEDASLQVLKAKRLIRAIEGELDRRLEVVGATAFADSLGELVYPAGADTAKAMLVFVADEQLGLLGPRGGTGISDAEIDEAAKYAATSGQDMFSRGDQ